MPFARLSRSRQRLLASIAVSQKIDQRIGNLDLTEEEEGEIADFMKN